MKFIELAGSKFGRLTAQWPSGYAGKQPRMFWLCSCECGSLKLTRGDYLRSGHTKSCGCFRREEAKVKFVKHGHNRAAGASPTYNSWLAIIKRCTNATDAAFEDYGGRGIAVCNRWRHSFENFLADMGEKPDGKTIDRINNNGNYEPSNCRWATAQQQAQNRRHRRWKKRPKVA